MLHFLWGRLCAATTVASAFLQSCLRHLISSLYQCIASFFFTVLVFSGAWSSMIVNHSSCHVSEPPLISHPLRMPVTMTKLSIHFNSLIPISFSILLHDLCFTYKIKWIIQTIYQTCSLTFKVHSLCTTPSSLHHTHPWNNVWMVSIILATMR